MHKLFTVNWDVKITLNDEAFSVLAFACAEETMQCIKIALFPDRGSTHYLCISVFWRIHKVKELRLYIIFSNVVHDATDV
jgi:hypothetical protein